MFYNNFEILILFWAEYSFEALSIAPLAIWIRRIINKNNERKIILDKIQILVPIFQN